MQCVYVFVSLSFEGVGGGSIIGVWD